MRILAIGSHFDDVELGCGGSLLRLGDEGHSITLFVATESGYSDPNGNVIRPDSVALAEGQQSAEVLRARLLTASFKTFELEFNESLNAILAGVVAEVQPDLVFTHWSGDTHHDHHALALSTLHVVRRVPCVLCYRSNWYDSAVAFTPKMYFDISEVFDRKVALIDIFGSEVARTRGTWQRYIESQASFYGLSAGVEKAEAFEVIKWRY